MDSVDIKMYSSKELRKMRQMIREELDFRADVEKEIVEREKKLDNLIDDDYEFPHIRERMGSMRDWDRRKSGGY